MIERQTIGENGKPERAILVGVCTRQMTFEQATEYLEELAFLTETAGGRAVRSFIQKLDKPEPATYVGKGKLSEIKEAIAEAEADLVIFDDDLSPSQIRNLDQSLGIKVLDRSSLILHIFSQSAKTAQARTQVDLAQYQYVLPRLAGMWTHLSRQKGGIGLKGAGEKEIETDRRIIRERIAHLQRELKKIERQGFTRRKNRSSLVRAALVGYTNVGKSTIMNLMTGSEEVKAENKLFATLDTTVRKVVMKGVPFLLSDTVGFIRKLPHHLVESFKSTLAEARESDVLVHVVDASHSHMEEHLRVVRETLRELDIQQKRVFTVFNKIDLLSPEERQKLETTWFHQEHMPAIGISARTGENVEAFREMLLNMLVELYGDRYPSPEQNPILDQYHYYRWAETGEPFNGHRVSNTDKTSTEKENS